MTDLILRLHEQDERALFFLVSRRLRLLDLAMRLVTHLADPLPVVLIAVLLGGARGMFALIVSHIWVQFLKRACCRPRPSLPIGIDSLVHAPDRFSFPSGHSAAGMSVAIALFALLPTAAGLAILALAVAVGASRCYLGVHYPGDVLAGWTLATLAYLLGGIVL